MNFRIIVQWFVSALRHILVAPIFWMGMVSVVAMFLSMCMLTHVRPPFEGVFLVIYFLAAVTGLVAPCLGLLMWGWSFLLPAEEVWTDWDVRSRGWILLAGLPVLANAMMGVTLAEGDFRMSALFAAAIVGSAALIAVMARRNHVVRTARSVP